jgi:Flp pilus assembly pilin Flp
MIRQLRHPEFGLIVAAVVAVLMAMPTAIEYAVMLGGISFNAID